MIKQACSCVSVCLHFTLFFSLSNCVYKNYVITLGWLWVLLALSFLFNIALIITVSLKLVVEQINLTWLFSPVCCRLHASYVSGEKKTYFSQVYWTGQPGWKQMANRMSGCPKLLASDDVLMGSLLMTRRCCAKVQRRMTPTGEDARRLSHPTWGT